MGRHQKKIISQSGIDRRLDGYYSTPEFVANFLAIEMMKISPKAKSVLDPCSGQEELVRYFIDSRLDVRTIDIFDHGVHAANTFEEGDFLAMYARSKKHTLFSRDEIGTPDLLVANPPYNCHEVAYVRDNKPWLDETFSEVGTHNMYSMFMYALIDSAKEGAVLGLIVSDSFLTHRAHTDLRKFILSTCSLHQIALCPMDLFRAQKADVRTCILLLQKGTKYQESVEAMNRTTSTAEFRRRLSERDFQTTTLDKVILDTPSDRCEIVIGCPPDIRRLFDLPRLGSQFPCVTGVSTGNDGLYVSKVKKEGFGMPFYKNPGGRRFFCSPDGYLPDNYLEISENNKTFIVRNKSLLGKRGVTCSSMGVAFGACRLPAGALFGVNANIICDDKDAWWLLAYLNSSLVTFLVRGVLLRTNMITSGYVSRLPILDLSKQTKYEIGKIAESAYEKDKEVVQSSVIAAIDAHIFESSEISERSVEYVRQFSADLLRLV